MKTKQQSAQQDTLSDRLVPPATINFSRKACDLVAENLRCLQSGDGNVASREQKKTWFLGITKHFWQHHPGYVALSTSEVYPDNQHDNTSMKRLQGTDKADGKCNVRLPCCRDCGSGLQPGLNGTTVRLHKRRNRKRKRQPKHLLLQQKSQPDPIVAWRDDQPTVAKKDRNFLVVKCGSCASKCIVPGLPDRRTKQSLGQQDPNVARQANRLEYVRTPESQDALPGNVDFIPLIASKRDEHPRGSGMKQKWDSSTASSSHGKPKKKMKGNQDLKKKSSQLYDFLSSLND